MQDTVIAPKNENTFSIPFRVLLVGLYRHSGRTASIALYLRMLRDELQDLSIPVEIFVPPLLLGRYSKCFTWFQKVLYAIDKLIFLPFLLKWRIGRRRSNDTPIIIHVVTEGHADCVRFIKRVPHLVTCHDVLPLRIIFGEIPHTTAGWQTRAYWRLQLQGLNLAQHVACVSEQTRRDLLQFSTLEDNQVSVIPNALNYPYTPMQTEEARSRIAKLLGQYPNGKFFLQVGRNVWYKNRIGVLRIFNGLRKAPGLESSILVAIGPPFISEALEYLRQHDMTSCVKMLHDIDEEDLRAFYSLAEGLIFPSFAEGFGWPIIEAQACGCPVFVSKRSPMTDIAGNGAIYFDPENTDEAIQEILGQWDQRAELSAQGLDNAKQFTSKRMAGSYVQLYLKLFEEFQDR